MGEIPVHRHGVDFDQHLTYKADRPVDLTPTEFGILAVVLVPAYVSLAALLAACLVIGVTATRELSATLRMAGATPWSRLGIGLGAAALRLRAAEQSKTHRLLLRKRSLSDSLSGGVQGII